MIDGTARGYYSAETADAFEEGQRRARDAGMTALTTKPLNIHELMALLAEHIPEK